MLKKSKISKCGVDYVADIEIDCSTPTCLDAQEAGTSINDQITSQLSTAIADGSLMSNMQAVSNEISNLLEVSTAVVDFGEVVISVPTAFTEWYPIWGGGMPPGCSNDIKDAPLYMKKDSNYYSFASLVGCCERYFSWVMQTCTGGSSGALATGKWYVNHQEQACQQDCPKEGGTPCGGLVKQEELYETAAS